MAGYRLPYTLDEDNTILRMIVASKLYYWLRGASFWRDLSAMGCLDRTWMSLQNRFEKFILPNLSQSQYDIPVIEKRKIELAWYQTSASVSKYMSSSSSSEEESSDSEEIIMSDSGRNAEKGDKNCDQEGPNNIDHNSKGKNKPNCSENASIVSPVTPVSTNTKNVQDNSNDLDITYIESQEVEKNIDTIVEKNNQNLDITCIESLQMENNTTTTIEGIMTDDDSDIIQINRNAILNNTELLVCSSDSDH